MVGGGGERKTLRLAARNVDACNLFAGPWTTPAQVAAKLNVLAAPCDRKETNVDRILKSVLWAARSIPPNAAAPSSPSCWLATRPSG